MPQTFRDRLIGAWELVCWSSTNKNDTKDVAYPLGKDCKGTIMYTPDGYISAMLQAADVPQWTPGPLKATDEEYIKTGTKTLGYIGPFYMDQEEAMKARLFHHMNVSLPPNWIGQTQIRMAEMKEEEGELYLYLKPLSIDDRDGVPRLQTVRWKKMKDNSRGIPPAADS